MALTDKLTAIADAIRTKTGTSDTMTLDEMAENISSIEEGSGETAIIKDTADEFVDGSIKYYANDALMSAVAYKFYKQTNLVCISLPACVNVLNYAFYNCENLVYVNMPQCTQVRNYGFYKCKNLSIINCVLTYIATYAFYGCSSLTSIDLSACTSLGSYAFYGCSSLTSIDLSACTTLDVNAFYGCSSLTSVTGEPEYIDSRAFYNCSSLTSIDLSNVTYISTYSFYGCSSLTSADLSACTNIDGYAFYGCTSLSKIWIPSTCTAIAAAMYSTAPFYNCSSTLEIYTDAEDEDSIPSGWGTCWNYYASGSTLTVHYGATHDEYEAA